MFLVLWRMQETIVMVFLSASGSDNLTDLIAGFGIGTFMILLFFSSIAFGLNGALETLVSQAYGAKDIDMCTVYLHRSRLVLVIFLIPITLLILKSSNVLKLLD